MKLFEVRPDESCRYHIEGAHRWGLPGLSCDICGATWADVGTYYPTVDLSELPNAQRYTKRWPVKRLEFEELRAPILPLVPPGAPAPPGTGLGPLVGKASGTFPDLLTPVSVFTLLVRCEVMEALSSTGILTLLGAVAELKGSKLLPTLLELQLEPYGNMAPECLPPNGFPACPACGRRGIVRPDRVMIAEDSVAEDRGIFRLCDLTTMIVATERVVEAITASGLRGALFFEVPVI